MKKSFTILTVVLEQCLDIQVTGMFQGSFEECYLRERKLVGIHVIPIGTDWTDMWEDITSQLWRLTQLPAMKNVASA